VFWVCPVPYLDALLGVEQQEVNLPYPNALDVTRLRGEAEIDLQPFER